MTGVQTCALPILLLCGCTAQASPPIEPSVWTPTPQPGVSRALSDTETVHVPSVEVWRAARENIAPHRVWKLLQICWCESRYDTKAVNPASGAVGACQQMPDVWGYPPPDLAGQFREADRIAQAAVDTWGDGHDYDPWDASEGCPTWNLE